MRSPDAVAPSGKQGHELAHKTGTNSGQFRRGTRGRGGACKMTGGPVERTHRAVSKFSPKGVLVRLPDPAPLAAPAQTSGVNQAPIYGDTITKPGFGGAKSVLQCRRRGKVSGAVGSDWQLSERSGAQCCWQCDEKWAGGSTFTVAAVW